MFVDTSVSKTIPESNNETLESLLIQKDSEIKALNAKFLSQTAEKDSEIRALKAQLFEKSSERDKLIQDLKTHIKLENEKYKENRDFLLTQYEKILISKADL
jgi:hypothetical protein